MQMLRRSFQRVNRESKHSIGAVIYIIIAIVGAANFNVTLENFLLLVAYWLGPWAIILILEHFVSDRASTMSRTGTLLAIYLEVARRSFSLAIGLVGVI